MSELIVSEFDMFAVLDTIDVCHEYIKTQEDEITRLRAQLEARRGEAVAYMFKDSEGLNTVVRSADRLPDYMSRLKRKAIPLYTHPAPVVPEYDAADLEVTAWPEQQVGMHVGMVKGVKIKQKSTGIEVCCDAERSQHRNRDKCIKMLSAAQE